MKKIIIVNRGGAPNKDLLALLKTCFPECEITGAFVIEGVESPYVPPVLIKSARTKIRERTQGPPSERPIS